MNVHIYIYIYIYVPRSKSKFFLNKKWVLSVLSWTLSFYSVVSPPYTDDHIQCWSYRNFEVNLIVLQGFVHKPTPLY